VVDLDTLMPGKAIFDLGDMIRSCLSASAEDDPDPTHASIDADVFQHLVEGWHSELASLLTARERALMYWSGRMLLFEQGVRFLTDHLQGDAYYKVSRPGHNVDRALNQLRLLKYYGSMENELSNRIVHLMR
jgi:hypothetical protein